MAVTRQQTQDGSYTLYSARYRQTYHSTHGAVTESRHVFLEGAGVRERLAAGLPARVLEIGFGTGLNFLLTADVALAHEAPLEYVAAEHDLLPAGILSGLEYGRWLHHPTLFEKLVEWRTGLPERPRPGLLACSIRDTLSLELLVGDACTIELEAGRFDAVYLDAFSPDTNPELWTAPFLQRIARALRPGARLATYSARGLVRRNLATAGFSVEKRAGPPGKREMVIATR